MTPPLQGVRAGLKALVLVTVGLAVGLGLQGEPRSSGTDPGLFQPPATRPEPTQVEGPLGRESLLALLGGVSIRDSLVAIVIQGRDCLTCEDLGRQLRQLAAAVPSSTAMLIAYPASDSVRVARFLMVERLAIVRRPVNASITLADGSAVPTPAVLVLDRTGRVLRGIAHPDAVRNVRAISFAHELGYLPEAAKPLLTSPE